METANRHESSKIRANLVKCVPCTYMAYSNAQKRSIYLQGMSSCENVCWFAGNPRNHGDLLRGIRESIHNPLLAVIKS